MVATLSEQSTIIPHISRSPQLSFTKTLSGSPLCLFVCLFVCDLASWYTFFPNSLFLDLIIQTAHGIQYNLTWRIVTHYAVCSCSPYFLSLTLRYFIRHNLYPRQSVQIPSYKTFRNWDYFMKSNVSSKVDVLYSRNNLPGK